MDSLCHRTSSAWPADVSLPCLRYKSRLALTNHPRPPANLNYGANLEHPFFIAYPTNATRASRAKNSDQRIRTLNAPLPNKSCACVREVRSEIIKRSSGHVSNFYFQNLGVILAHRIGARRALANLSEFLCSCALA